jgi:hypothetical protein
MYQWAVHYTHAHMISNTGGHKFGWQLAMYDGKHHFTRGLSSLIQSTAWLEQHL